ncbi:MAG: hypothetical protein ABI120_20810 [Gemmatimonadaceae bacterium]
MPSSSIRKYLSIARKGIVVAALLSAALFGAWKLTMGPLYRTNTAAQCQTKYAHATTLTETTTVDFQPYADRVGNRRLRCAMTRATTLSGIK